jgi:hypothetical protein
MRINRLDGVTVQTKHIAQLTLSFMSAATPLYIVKTFNLLAICFIIDDEVVLRCQARADKARLLLTTPWTFFLGCDEIEDAISDDEKTQAFREGPDLLLHLLRDTISRYAPFRKMMNFQSELTLVPSQKSLKFMYLVSLEGAQ